MSKYIDLKQKVFECNMELPQKRVVIYTFGNVSAIDRKEGIIAIKPSGVSYEKMTVNDMVIVDLDGKVVEGTLRPSSDTKTHLVLYKKISGHRRGGSYSFDLCCSMGTGR